MNLQNIVASSNEYANIDVLEISHSSIKTFLSCPRKFEFRKLHNCSIKEETLAMKGGTALHIGVQHALATDDIDAGLFELIWAFDMQWQKSPMEARSLETYIATYLEVMNADILQEYKLAKIQTTTGEMVPATEVSFAIDICNFPFFPDGRTVTVRYVGFIDLIMYSVLTDTYAVWDIKTTTKEIDHDVEFRYDEQCVPYGLALEAILGIQHQNNFDVAYWIARLNVTQPKSLLYRYIKNSVDVQDWLKNLFKVLQDIKLFYNAGWFPRRSSACMGYNRKCTYFDFCETRNTGTINMMLGQSLQQQLSKPREPIVPFITIKVDAGDI